MAPGAHRQCVDQLHLCAHGQPPRPGGPSFAVAPDGEVLVETTDPVALVEIDPTRVESARSGYPGYLAAPSDLYTAGWSQIPPKAAHQPPGG